MNRGAIIFLLVAVGCHPYDEYQKSDNALETKADAATPDASQADVWVEPPDAATGDTTIADAAVTPDAAVDDIGRPDTALADASPPDSATSDVGGPEGHIYPCDGHPTIFFSDLVNGPKDTGQGDAGAFVTIWGQGFGASRGTSHITIGGGQAQDYLVWTDRKVSFQLGANAQTGNIVVHTDLGSSNGVPFLINSGRVYFADLNSSNAPGAGTHADPWRSPKSFYEQLSPGDILYIRGGVYSEQYGKSFMGGDYQVMTGVTGEENAHIAWIAYPGEQVTFVWGQGRHFGFIDKQNSNPANYQVVSQIVMDGQGTGAVGGVSTEGWYQSQENGAHHVRVVGCRITNCAKGSATTMTGHVRFTADGSKLLGTEIDNCGVKTNPYNNNHLVYVQCGADDIEIAHNHFHDSAAGHCIQVHADNPGRYQYDRIHIHSNFITADNPGDMRGPTVSNVLPDTTVYFYNNIVANIGWFSGFNLVNGNAWIFNNTFYNVGGNGVVSLMSDNGQHMFLERNIMWSNGSAPYVHLGTYGTDTPSWDSVSADENFYFNNGVGPAQDSHALNEDPLLTDPENGSYLPQSGATACPSSGLCYGANLCPVP